MTKNIFENLKKLIQAPDLCSRNWIFEQYDRQVMNDTIQTGGDAAIVRVHATNKALALTSDCTARYVESDPFEGAKQAVVETYRNICAVGGKPLAVTNCLNFGNPEKPEIMGQIVRAIKGINEACKALNYPVVSGNVSLYNETDGKAIQPTPTIGGVGLLKDLEKRCDISFKNVGDEVFVIGKTHGYIGCSIYERDILGIEGKNPSPRVDLQLEKKHGEFIRSLIGDGKVNSSHDISDGGLLLALFEMSTEQLGIDIDLSAIKSNIEDDNHLLFSEDQSRYIISVDKDSSESLIAFAKAEGIELFKIGSVAKDNITIREISLSVKDLKKLNEEVLVSKFG